MTPFVCFYILNWSAFILCLRKVTFYGRSLVRLSGLLSLNSWTVNSKDALYAVYVGSFVLIGFWLLLTHFLVGSPLWLADLESQPPSYLVCCCTGTARIKQNNPANNTHTSKNIPQSLLWYHNKWAKICKRGKRIRILYKGNKNMWWLMKRKMIMRGWGEK